MKQGVVRAVFVGAMVIAMVAGLCGVGATVPLSVDSHWDHSVGGWFGYHYSIDVWHASDGTVDEPVAEFVVFCSPFGALESETVFQSSFFQGDPPDDGPNAMPAFGLYAQGVGGSPLVNWSSELIFNGPLTDPVYPSVNDYVRWSGPAISAPAAPGTATCLYFGFCNTAPAGDRGWRIDDRVPPFVVVEEVVIWEPIHAPIPEPSGLLPLGTGMLGLGGVLFRRRRR